MYRGTKVQQGLRAPTPSTQDHILPRFPININSIACSMKTCVGYRQSNRPKQVPLSGRVKLTYLKISHKISTSQNLNISKPRTGRTKYDESMTVCFAIRKPRIPLVGGCVRLALPPALVDHLFIRGARRPEFLPRLLEQRRRRPQEARQWPAEALLRRPAPAGVVSERVGRSVGRSLKISHEISKSCAREREHVPWVGWFLKLTHKISKARGMWEDRRGHYKYRFLLISNTISKPWAAWKEIREHHWWVSRLQHHQHNQSQSQRRVERSEPNEVL